MTRSLPKRPATIILLILLLSLVAIQPSEARRNRVSRHKRTTVIVHKSFPLHRRLPTVIVHPVHSRATFVVPARYLPVAMWKAPIVVTPAPDRIVWEDSDTFTADDDWTEVSLGVHDRGTALLLHLSGIARLDFAEVVFANGDVQVVDFNNKLIKTGTFELMAFGEVRDVSYVRLLGRAESETAVVSLRMVK